MEGKKVFCIFNKEVGGAVRVQRDHRGLPRAYVTRELAEQEIANSVVSRIFQLFGRESEQEQPNTLSVRDYVREVRLLENGIVVDAEGNEFL